MDQQWVCLCAINLTHCYAKYTGIPYDSEENRRRKS